MCFPLVRLTFLYECHIEEKSNRNTCSRISIIMRVKFFLITLFNCKKKKLFSFLKLLMRNL